MKKLFSSKIDWKNSLIKASYLILGAILISIISSLFHAHLTKLFFTLPNISGWDGAAHEAIMDLYSKQHFPSTWGWLSNWYSGMPFPILYPPLMYLLGSAITLITDSSIVAYKGLSLLSLIAISASTLIFLILIFKKDKFNFKNENETINKANYTSYIFLILSIALMLGINSGSPGPRSLFYNSMLAQNISLIFLIPALYSLIARAKYLKYIGAIFWTLIYISSIHTAFSGLALSGFLFIFQWLQNKNKKHFIDLFKKYSFIHIFGLLGASFWILPMLGSYEYFTGAAQQTLYDIITLTLGTWPHLIIALIGIYYSWRQKDKYPQIYLWSITIASAIFFTSILYVIQYIIKINIPLPIYFHRWFETFFFLLIIPYSFIILRIVNKNTYGKILVIAIFSITLIYYINNPRTEDHIYKSYSDNRLVRLISLASTNKSIQNSNIVMVQSNWKEPDQDILDAEIGRNGGQTGYSNLVESSINSIFMRMARNAISGSPDTWSLNNNYLPMHTGAIHLKHQLPLLDHLGIKSLIIKGSTPNSPHGYIYIEDSSGLKADNSVNGFSFINFNRDIPFASLISGHVSLYIGENGFRQRTIQDINYTRLQESIFEKGLINKLFTINVGKIPVENLIKLQNISSSTIIANSKIYSIDELSKYIESRQGNHKIYFYNDSSKNISGLIAKYKDSENIIFFKSKYNKYPFDPVLLDIESNTPNDINEIRVKVTNRNSSLVTTEISSDILQNNNWLFLRQSYHPSWMAEEYNTNNISHPIVTKTFMSSPGFTIIPLVNKTSSSTTITINLTFPPSRLFYTGHLLSLAIFMFMILLAIYDAKKSIQ